MRLIRRAARAFGIDIIRAQPPARTFAEIQAALVPDASVIFDVGAYIGETVTQYRALFPSADIFAFEPFPESFAALATALPGDAQFHPHNIALGEKEGALLLHSNISAATNSVLATSASGPQFWGSVVDTRETVPVFTSTISAFCTTHGIAAIDILKLDVQGAELSVLQGGQPLLAAGAVKMVYAEMLVAPTYVGQAAIDEVLKFMRDLHFTLYDIQNPCHRRGRLCQFDALFLSQSAEAELG